MAQYISDGRKKEIVNKVRDNGTPVSALALEYGVSSKSIYTLLREGVIDGNRNLILENLG